MKRSFKSGHPSKNRHISHPAPKHPSHGHKPKRGDGHGSGVEGRLQLKGRVGFVLSEDPKLTDVLIDGPSLRLAMDGDRVRVRVTSEPTAARRAGHIEKVVEHARQTVVGVFVRRNGAPWLQPEGEVPPVRLLELPLPPPKEGELIAAKITEWPTEQQPAAGTLTEILGTRDTPGVELKVLIRKYDLPDAFPPEVETEAAAFGDEVPETACADRQTFFNQRVFTIDGKDAKDFDDAVSIQQLPDGWRVGVHIADVSHYVRPGTALDKEAYHRGTSVYLSGAVLPMLPFPLSDNLCSLRPDCLRLTLSCVMDIELTGRVVSTRFYESAIRSARRFTYEDVDKILRGQSLAGLSRDIHEDVRRMAHVARLLRDRRFARGSLDFDFPEPEVIMDPHGRPTDIQRRERLESHRLIEDFMLLANETVAQHMKKGPFLFRIHDTPDPVKLEKLRKALEAVGLPIPKGFDQGTPLALQKVIATSEGKPIQSMVQTMTLRSLKQAVYSPINRGHFGLASVCYTHFTSPIRRYPDLIVHRLVKDRLHNRSLAGYESSLTAIAQHCSRRERIAVDAEREYFDLQKVRLMESHVGESFDGVISGVTAFGIFVQLKDFFVEGLVHISRIPGDYYIFDEVRMSLRGKRSGRAFEMGQPVRVKVAAANTVKRQLDFELM